MNSDEEYLDDFINSLMKEEAGEGPASSEEGETEGFGLGEETVPKDLDFAIEDLMPEEFDAGDFVLEEPGQEELRQENLPEELTLEEEPGQEELRQENLPEEPALEEERGQEELSEEPALEELPEESALEEEPEQEELEQENLPEEPALEEEPGQEELEQENLPEESVPEDIPDEEPASENEWEENPVFDDFGLSDFQVDEEENEEFHNGEESLISPDEVDAMFAAADAAADADVSALEEDALFDADLQTDEIFDFLDGMPEGEEGNGEPNPDGGQEMPAEEDDQGNKKKKKKAKKEKKPLFGRKKKEQPEEAAGTEESEEGASEEAEEKKTGLFGKIMTFLTETDDEEEEESKADGLEPSDENKNILKELDDEDKKKKKKKVKTKDGEEGKKEKKKKKKEKKKKEKPEADSEGTESLSGVKKGKRVSIKSIAVIAAFCLTVTAVIIVTCSIIPDFFEKRKAREAFYQSDYMKSYELMYGKKLDESDDIIYNKAKTILEIKRKLDSYHNYLGMGKEVQALDALMSGVEHYPEILAKAEEYRVTQEVNAIYESILNILNDKYSLGEAVAQTIVAYDDVTYTKRLESIVYHTPFIMPEEKTEREETVTTADILPEEQELMEEQMPAAEDMLPEEEFPQEETQEQQGSDPAEQETAEEPDVQEENSSQGEDVSQWDNMSQGNETSQGEDVSTWTGDSGFGNQGEQIQGIRQPLNIEIHGN